jgi:hypothetical protein
MALLCGCSGYTPQDRVATWDESITFFEKNKKNFEELRDQLLADKESRFIVYDTGACTTLSEGGPMPSKEHLKEYVARLNKLGLPSACKTYVDDPKYPIVSFGLSATGLVGNGPSVELSFTKGKPGITRGRLVKIEKTGWYLDTDQYDENWKRYQKD